MNSINGIFMVSMELWYIGKPQNNFIHIGVDKYSKRISRYIPFKVHSLGSIRRGSKYSINELQRDESNLIINKLSNRDYFITLDEKGRKLSSSEFAVWLDKWQNMTRDKIIFQVGGAYGFHDSITKRSNFNLALSSLTFSHELARLVFVEQLYRAFTILRNEPYHNA